MKKYYQNNKKFKIIKATDNTDNINKEVEGWLF
jgi:hypothetical protein